MLEVNQTINLNGYSKINGVNVAYLSATIATDDNSSATTNTSVLNQELYKSHKREVRKDINDFEEKVYKVEDSLEAEKDTIKKTEKETTTLEKQS